MIERTRPRLEVELFLDCGVFSAYRVRKTIDVKDYARFIEDYKELLKWYVTLDVLPMSKAKNSKGHGGGGEHLRSDQDVEEAAAASDYNHQYLKDRGLTPIPVFHMGEDFKWLERMLNNGEKNIGVSTVKAFWNKPARQAKWLDQVYSVLCNAQGEPLVKTHGFGITSARFLFAYPFNTVDSTTWSQTPGYGTVLYPPLRLEDGELDYYKDAVRVAISDVPRLSTSSSKWRNSRRNNFSAMSEEGLYQEAVKKFLDEIGVTQAEVRDSSHLRRKAMLLYYRKMQEHAHDIRFKRGTKMEQDPVTAGMKPIIIRNLKMILATTINNGAWAELMTELGVRRRLLSYWELRKTPEKRFIDYVTTGLVTGYSGYTPHPPKSTEPDYSRWEGL